MLVELEGVRVEAGGETILVVEDLRLEGPGLVQVIGPNGAGKTTLLRTIAGLIRPASGTVKVGGVDVTGDPSRAGRFIGYVPQRPPVSRSNPITVYDLVASRASFRRRWPRVLLSGSVRRTAEAALGEAGVPREAWGKRLWELSGGQLMRAFIARALVADTSVLLMDEPLAPVDPAGKRRLADKIVELSRGKLVVVTSHDPELLLPATRTLVLVRRRIVAYGPPEEVLRESVLREVYGESVIVAGSHLHIYDEHYARGVRGA